MQMPADIQVWGYTADELERIAKFDKANPTIRKMWVLRDLGITKNDCYKIVADAGIELPMMYRLGYNNNNCIGCVKGGAGYWNKIRKDFPEQFERMAKVSRRMGVKMIKITRNSKTIRIFLDELPIGAGNYEFEGDIDCGPQCVMPSYEETENQNQGIQ
jgi:hypothetical protein